MQVRLENVTLARFLTVLIVLLANDGLWFRYSLHRVYTQIDRSQVRLRYGVGAWCLLALAISAAASTKTRKEALSWGAAVGLVCYGVFNSTELAIRSDWTVRTALADTLWGIFSCCAAAGLLVDV